MRDVTVKSVSADGGSTGIQAVLDVPRSGGLIPAGDTLFADKEGTQPVARVKAEADTLPDDLLDHDHLRGRYELELLGLPIREGATLWAH